MENVHLAIGQLFNANGRKRRTMFRLRLQRFFKCAHRHVAADVNVPSENIAKGSQQFFFWRCFHHVTVCAGAQAALCEDCFLKGGIDKDQQTGFLSLERLNKFQAVAGTEPQSRDNQLRFAFRDLIPRIANVAGLTAYQQVRLSIQTIGDPIAKQRMFFQDQDASFCDGPSWNAYASLSRFSECEISFFQWTHIVALGGTSCPGGEHVVLGGNMLSWGNRMTTVNSIHAKFGKTFLMNDGSPCLPLNHKVLTRARSFEK